MEKVIKNILIIGGSSGFGLELALQYAELGHILHYATPTNFYQALI